MEKVMDEDIAEVINNGDKIAIKFEKSGRYYNVDEKGNIEQFTPYVDTTPGVLAQNSNGEYMVESIEDLVALSAGASSNDGYSDDNVTISSFSLDKTVVLMCDLDFKSPLSYVDSTTDDYNGYLGVQDENITLMEALTNIKKYKGFIPIGNSSRSFAIIFDGKDHWIRNLNENVEDDAGLFGTISHGVTIKNLTITGEINSTTYAGGIVGRSYGEITNCINYAKVSGNSAGGICGDAKNALIFNNCINYGAVISNNYSGGILGYAYRANVGANQQFNYCINAGYVSGSIAGGIMGACKSGEITFNSCLNSIDAVIVGGATSGGNAGGIIGGKLNVSNFYIYNCANIGSVSGYYSGGIYGSRGDNNILANCFGGGNITGTYPGGIAGECNNEVAYNCFYLKSKNVNYSVGYQAQDKITATQITEVTKQNLIDKLNSYIDNPEGEGIDTTGWKKWTLDKNGNPTFVE